jgi:hypothetical protein
MKVNVDASISKDALTRRASEGYLMGKDFTPKRVLFIRIKYVCNKLYNK